MDMSDGAPWNKCGRTPTEVYERYLVPAIFLPWSDLLLDAAGFLAQGAGCNWRIAAGGRRLRSC